MRGKRLLLPQQEIQKTQDRDRDLGQQFGRSRAAHERILKSNLKTKQHLYNVPKEKQTTPNRANMIMRSSLLRLTTITLCLCITTTLFLTGCSGVKSEAKYPTGYDRTLTDGDIYAKPGSIFGDEGGGLFGRSKKGDDSGEGGLAINAYLWRASLDTVSFMPLASADPFGGVILTDWYSNPKKPKERFKINIFILDKQLRSDGIKVKVFNEILKKGRWTASTVASGTARKLEDTILTRARQLRVAKLEE